MINLYLFNDTDSAAIYGIGAYLIELTNALKNSDINIHIVHLRSNRPKFEIEQTNQFEIWHVPTFRNESNSLDAIQEVEEYFRNVVFLLRMHIKDTKNLIFQFNYHQCQVLAKELKAVFDCKTIAVVHYFKWTLDLHGNLHRLSKIKAKTENERTSFEQLIYLAYEYEKALFKEVDRVIAFSQTMQHILIQDYQIEQDKISVIPNGLHDTGSAPITNRKMLRNKWRIAEKESIILFAGRLQSVKGLNFLIKAFRKVLEHIPDCRLMIAGNGNFDTYMQEAKAICTKITFTGLLDKTELQELYQIADVGVVPSLFETFGYVAVEMMMHELPIVVTATSGLNELIDDTCGLKVPVIEHPYKVELDIDILTQKILFLLQHPKDARRLGKNGRKRFLKFYSSSVFRRNMLNFYTLL